MSFVVQFISLIWAVLVVPIALLLGCTAVTWSGRGFALAALLAGVSPLLGSLAIALEKRKWRRLSAALLLGAGVLYGSLALRTSHIRSPAEFYPLRAGTGMFSRLSPFQILPEQDQLAAGYVGMTAMDPLLTFSQAMDLRRLTADVYSELGASPEFEALPSELPGVYADLTGLGTETASGFLFVPRSVDRSTPAPAIVFLHGSGGNLKAYTWILRRVAEKSKSVLVCPSDGMGNWSEPETSRRVQAALQQARSVVPIDPHRLVISGLSNGGLGVCQLLTAPAPRWRSVILISPVFDEVVLEHFGAEQVSVPIIVISGTRDDRVPIDYVRKNAATLGRLGGRIELKEWDDNHFLMFRQRQKLTETLAAWMEAQPAPTQP